MFAGSGNFLQAAPVNSRECRIFIQKHVKNIASKVVNNLKTRYFLQRQLLISNYMLIEAIKEKSKAKKTIWKLKQIIQKLRKI